MDYLHHARRPTLILPNAELPPLRVEETGGRSKPAPPKPSRLDSWLHIAERHQTFMRDLIMNPRRAESIFAVRAALRGLRRSGTARQSVDSSKRVLAITYNPLSGHYDAIPLAMRNGNGYTLNELVAQFGNRVIDGARILVIPDQTLPNEPRLVALSAVRDNGWRFVDFWVPPAAQRRPRGSAIALHLAEGVRKRFSISDFMRAILAKATAVRQQGKTPAMVIDLDGTTFNARLYAWHLLGQWLDSFVSTSKAELDETARLKEVIASLDKPVLGWDIPDTLKLLGTTDENLLASGREYFRKHYFCPERNLHMPPIGGMIKVVKFLQSMGIAAIFNTNRAQQRDSLCNGSSSTMTALREQDIWDENSALIMGDGTDRLKTIALNEHLEQHPPLEVVFVAENITELVRDYGKQLPRDVVIGFVEGDRVPGTEKELLPDNVYAIGDVDDLEADFDEWEAKGHHSLYTQFSDDGTTSAQRLLTTASRIRGLAKPHRRLISANWIEESTQEVLSTLNEMTSYPEGHPTHIAFTEQLNQSIGRRPGAISAFEESIGIINAAPLASSLPHAFAVTTNPAGIFTLVRIARA